MWVKICGLTRFQDAQVAIDAGADALGFVFEPRSKRHLPPHEGWQSWVRTLDTLRVLVLADPSQVPADWNLFHAIQLTLPEGFTPGDAKRLLPPLPLWLALRVAPLENLTSPDPLSASREGGADLTPPAPLSASREGGADLTPPDPLSASREGGADLTPPAPLSASREGGELAGSPSPFTERGLGGEVNTSLPTERVQGNETIPDPLLPTLEQWAPYVERFILDSYHPSLPGGTGEPHDWERACRICQHAPRPIVLAGGLTPETVAQAIRIVRPDGVDVSSGVEQAPGIKDPVRIRLFIQQAKGGLNG